MEPTPKKLSEFAEGEVVTAFLFLSKKSMRRRRTGEPFLQLDLNDSTGSIRGNVWDDADRVNTEIETGNIVKIKGRVGSFRDELTLGIDRIRHTSDDDQVNLEDFVPASDKDVASMYQELLQVATGLEDKYLKNLVHHFYLDHDFQDRFTKTPGGKAWHHAYLGGLTEHVLGVTRVCEKLADLYPQLRRDLLLSGALLHDIGKITEFEYEGNIDYTVEGRLVGHIVTGSQMVASAIQQIPGFPDDIRIEIHHLIISHQGKKEYSTPIEPMTLEANLLYLADEIDSKANAILGFSERNKDTSSRFSWAKPMDRMLYLIDYEDR